MAQKHKCEVKDGLDDICSKPAVVLIEDVVCKSKTSGLAFLYVPFWVCKEHKKTFLEGSGHYKEVKRKRKG